MPADFRWIIRCTCQLFRSPVKLKLWSDTPMWYKSAKTQIFPHYESAKKLLRKRNSDRYKEPQQRFTNPQTGLCTIGAMYSGLQIQQSGVHVCTPVTAGHVWTWIQKLIKERVFLYYKDNKFREYYRTKRKLCFRCTVKTCKARIETNNVIVVDCVWTVTHINATSLHGLRVSGDAMAEAF